MKPKTLYVKSGRDLAALFGVDQRTIRKWISAGMPARTKRGYDLSAVCPWIIARRAPAGAESLVEVRTRYLATKADTEQVRLDKLRRRYILRAEADRQAMRLILTFKGLLLRVAGELPSRLRGVETADPIALQKVVLTYVNELCDELAAGKTVWINEGDDDEPETSGEDSV